VGKLVTAEALYQLRLAHLRKTMLQQDVPVLLVLDPVNILYATGASNMTLFSTRTPARYLLLFAEGPTILFDYFGCEHLGKDLPTIDQVLPATGLCFTSASADIEGNSRRFAAEIAALNHQYCANENRLAVDRFPFPTTDALREKGFHLSDADAVFSLARRHKLGEEIEYMREAMTRVEQAVGLFQQKLIPGQKETESWAEFQRGLLAAEGMYVTTRLMQTGNRTFPYFQECSDRVIESGDLVCLDTDSIGYFGYAVDFSRSFIAGEKRPSPAQSALYQQAREQLEWNIALFKPGIDFVEIAEKAWPVPDEYRDSRYYCIAHGLGMSGEFPNIPHQVKGQDYPLAGHLEPGMVVCIESYVGSARLGQGVKLEQQLYLHENGVECMSQYPLDSSF
jgi:Xaa-Pro dipeptidase